MKNLFKFKFYYMFQSPLKYCVHKHNAEGFGMDIPSPGILSQCGMFKSLAN
jgi:hypothetical protein